MLRRGLRRRTLLLRCRLDMLLLWRRLEAGLRARLGRRLISGRLVGRLLRPLLGWRLIAGLLRARRLKARLRPRLGGFFLAMKAGQAQKRRGWRFISTGNWLGLMGATRIGIRRDRLKRRRHGSLGIRGKRRRGRFIARA